MIEANGLAGSGFFQWAFYPGMLFLAPDFWWGELSRRKTPHEGLDLRFYTDQSGSILTLGCDTMVPAMMKGSTVKIEEDFLGSSAYFRTDTTDETGARLYYIYGHIVPSSGLITGSQVEKGQIVGTLSPKRGKTGAEPHLHLSIAWIRDDIEAEQLSWNMIANSKEVCLENPLPFICDRCHLVGKDLLPPKR